MTRNASLFKRKTVKETPPVVFWSSVPEQQPVQCVPPTTAPTLEAEASEMTSSGATPARTVRNRREVIRYDEHKPETWKRK